MGFEKYGLSVLWVGMPGMQWYSLVSIVHSLINAVGIPKAVIIHCGGNDLGCTPNGNLLFHLRFALYVVMKMLPGCFVIYSSILPRSNWRFSDNVDAMEKTRKRVNRGVRSFLLNNNGFYIHHSDLDDGHEALLSSDGVHLSFLGNDIFINALQSALEQFILYPHNRRFPS